jgi:hypothetical protein
MMRQIPVWVKVGEETFKDFDVMDKYLTDEMKSAGVVIAGPVVLSGTTSDNRKWLSDYETPMMVSFINMGDDKMMSVSDGSRVHPIILDGTVYMDDKRIAVPTLYHGLIHVRKFDRSDLASLPVPAKHRKSVKAYVDFIRTPDDEEE